MHISVAITAVLLVSTSLACRQTKWKGYKDAMQDSGAPWYLYEQKVGIGFQKMTAKCAVFLPVQDPQDPRLWHTTVSYVNSQGQAEEIQYDAIQPAANGDVAHCTMVSDGQTYHFNLTIICGEVENDNGKMLAMTSCNEQNGNESIWVMFNNRRTANDITDAEKTTVSNCLKRYNIDESTLQHVDNNNCP